MAAGGRRRGSAELMSTEEGGQAFIQAVSSKKTQSASSDVTVGFEAKCQIPTHLSKKKKKNQPAHLSLGTTLNFLNHLKQQDGPLTS